MFGAWGRFVYRFRWFVLVLSLLLVAGSVFGIVRLQTPLESNDGGDKNLEAWRAATLLKNELPAQETGTSFTLIFTARDPNLKATDPAFTSAVDAAVQPLRDDPRIMSVTTNPNFVSRDGRRAFVNVSMRDKFSEATRQYDEVRAKVTSDTLTILATGNVPLNHDFAKVSEQDLQRAEVVALPLALLLLTVVFGMVLWQMLRRSSLSTVGLALALVFGALAVAFVPIVVGAFAFLGGLAGIFALAHQRAMSIYALNIASMIGLGLAIDYSLFLVSRFLEELPRRPVAQAIERTVATTGKAIVFSGLTVAIGVAGLLFYHSTMLNSIGLAAIMVVVTAVFYGLTFLTAFMAIVGNGLAGWTRRRAARRTTLVSPRAASTTSGYWHRLANGVMDHPWLVLLPLLTILLVAGSPFVRLRLGLTDATALPAQTESRQGWELLTREFASSETTSLATVVNYPGGQPLTAERIGNLYDYSRRLAALPGVVRVRGIVDLPAQNGKTLTRDEYIALYTAPRQALPVEVQGALRQSVGEHVVSLSVLTNATADSDDARNLVRAVRATSPPAGSISLVGGETAFIIDLTDSLKRDTVPAAGFVMLATYVVLFLLLGSILLPLKAVAMNLLSISASYGALVWIFQEGHLSNFLDFTPGSIDPTVPVLMFCLLFGLSMDYEVLLLSRMKEEYDRSGDNRFAVAEGLEQTGRLITGAAAIMVSIFGAFALANLTIIKSIGLGMAIAVAVDALIVRTLIVPATMRLLGDLNWWAPAPLARLYRRLGLSHEGQIDELPEPAVAPGLTNSVSPATTTAAASTTEREAVGAGSGQP